MMAWLFIPKGSRLTDVMTFREGEVGLYFPLEPLSTESVDDLEQHFALIIQSRRRRARQIGSATVIGSEASAPAAQERSAEDSAPTETGNRHMKTKRREHESRDDDADN